MCTWRSSWMDSFTPSCTRTISFACTPKYQKLESRCPFGGNPVWPWCKWSNLWPWCHRAPTCWQRNVLPPVCEWSSPTLCTYCHSSFCLLNSSCNRMSNPTKRRLPKKKKIKKGCGRGNRQVCTGTFMIRPIVSGPSDLLRLLISLKFNNKRIL